MKVSESACVVQKKLRPDRQFHKGLLETKKGKRNFK